MEMNAGNITLYVDSNFISPYAMSVFVTLVEKNIPVEISKVDLGSKENYQTEYSALSRTCRVPTLSIGKFHLSESSAITEYLEDQFPAPEFAAVYPDNLEEKATARQIQAWLRSDFLEIREERSTEVVFHSKKNTDPLSGDAKRSFTKLISALENMITDGNVNLFKDWCIADTELALMINRLILNDDEVPEKLIKYAEHQWQRESVQKWITLGQT